LDHLEEKVKNEKDTIIAINDYIESLAKIKDE
jgi:hypothetical protein